jgi:hypothetical protein
LQRRVVRSNVATLAAKWHVPIEQGMRAEPVVANGVVFAGNVSGAIDALRADDGKRKALSGRFNRGGRALRRFATVSSTPRIRAATGSAEAGSRSTRKTAT